MTYDWKRLRLQFNLFYSSQHLEPQTIGWIASKRGGLLHMGSARAEDRNGVRPIEKRIWHPVNPGDVNSLFTGRPCDETPSLFCFQYLTSCLKKINRNQIVLVLKKFSKKRIKNKISKSKDSLILFYIIFFSLCLVFKLNILGKQQWRQEGNFKWFYWGIIDKP